MPKHVITVAMVLAMAVVGRPAVESDSAPDEASLRSELTEAWQLYRAWAYFFDDWARQRFDNHRRDHRGPLDEAWRAYVAKQQDRYSRISQPFDVTPELAEEFAGYLQDPNNRTNTAPAFAVFAEVLWGRATEKFQAFLSKYPDSDFSPQMNAAMAELVQEAPALRGNRSGQMQKAAFYLRRAVDEYGRKFSYPALHARATLANWADSLDVLLQHYRWQMNLIEAGTLADIYPTEDISQFVNGRPMRLGPDRLAVILKGAKRNLRVSLGATIATIVRRASPPELERIVAQFPGTKLAKSAADPHSVLHNRTPPELRELLENHPETDLAKLAAKKLKERHQQTHDSPDPTLARPRPRPNIR